MEAKRRALDEIATRQRMADKKQKREIDHQRTETISPVLVVQ
jgi:hypothetical protein